MGAGWFGCSEGDLGREQENCRVKKAWRGALERDRRVSLWPLSVIADLSV